MIRAWVEPDDTGEGDEAVRARVITVEHGDPDSEQVSTAAGVGRVMELVREFLTGLASGDGPGRRS